MEKRKCFTKKESSEICKSISEASKEAKKFLDEHPDTEIKEYTIEGDSALYYWLAVNNWNWIKLTFDQMCEKLSSMWKNDHYFAVEVVTNDGTYRFPKTGVYFMNHLVRDEKVFLSLIFEKEEVKDEIVHKKIEDIKLFFGDNGERWTWFSPKKKEWVICIETNSKYHVAVKKLIATEFQMYKYLVDRCFIISKKGFGCNPKDMRYKQQHYRNRFDNWIEFVCWDPKKHVRVTSRAIEMDKFAQSFIEIPLVKDDKLTRLLDDIVSPDLPF